MPKLQCVNSDKNGCDFIITFASSHYALKAERSFSLVAKEIKAKLISAPRTISTQCGFCLLLVNCTSTKLRTLIGETGVHYQNIYSRETIDGVKYYARED